MSCPACQHTMHNLGVPAERIFWCPRCGTIKSYNGEFENVSRPLLVTRAVAADLASEVVGVNSRKASTLVPLPFWVAVCEAIGRKAVGA